MLFFRIISAIINTNLFEFGNLSKNTFFILSLLSSTLSCRISIPTMLANAFNPSLSVLHTSSFRLNISTRKFPFPQAGSKKVLSIFSQTFEGIKSHMALTSLSCVNTSPYAFTLYLLFIILKNARLSELSKVFPLVLRSSS